MKKIILAALLACSAQYASANSTPTSEPELHPAFAQAESLIKANNYKAAYDLLNKLADEGNAQAIYNVGYLTQTGQGTTQDIKKAVQLYQLSARKGYPVANYVLGKNYAEGGLGLKPDINKAKEYLEKASQLKFDDATVELATLLLAESKPESNQRALSLLNPLVAKGHPQAQYVKALYDMSIGVKNSSVPEVNKALKSIQDLAQKGYVPAVMGVANMLAAGQIVEQNLEEARKLFAQLAQNNVSNAQASLDQVNQMIAQKAQSAGKTQTATKKK